MVVAVVDVDVYISVCALAVCVSEIILVQCLSHMSGIEDMFSCGKT